MRGDRYAIDGHWTATRVDFQCSRTRADIDSRDRVEVDAERNSRCKDAVLDDGATVYSYIRSTKSHTSFEPQVQTLPADLELEVRINGECIGDSQVAIYRNKEIG